MKTESWESVLRLVADARNKGQLFTNFFADEFRMAPWCASGSLVSETDEDTTFFLHRQEGFESVYFFAQNADSLSRSLARLLEARQNARLVVDVLGPDRMRVPIEDAFKANGFAVLTTLQRMGRKTPVEAYEADLAVVAATNNDISQVEKLLASYFDAEQEQIPDKNELLRWVSEGGLRVIHGLDGRVEGFVIYDLSPAQLYLRYWFVHPDARGNGEGGKLLRTMFAAGAKTKRQYFWVKTDNKNAIIRYQHYGFVFEPMKDTVLAIGGERK